MEVGRARSPDARMEVSMACSTGLLSLEWAVHSIEPPVVVCLAMRMRLAKVAFQQLFTPLPAPVLLHHKALIPVQMLSSIRPNQ